MIPFYVSALVGALALLIIAIAYAVWRSQQPSARVISVSARGEARPKPNVATVALGLQTTAKTLQNVEDARARNAETVRNVAQQVTALDDDAKLKTLDFRVTPVRDNKSNKIAEFRIKNEFQVKTRKLDRVAAIVDAALRTGAAGVDGIGVEGIDYALDSRAYNAAEADAQRSAMQQAWRKAQIIASESKGRVGRVVRVAQSDAGTGLRAFRMASTPQRAMLSAASEGGEMLDTPIEAPESIEINRQVEVEFELA